MLVCAEMHRNFDFHGGLCWFVLKIIETSIFKVVCAGFVLGLCWFVLKCLETLNLKVVCAGLC